MQRCTLFLPDLEATLELGARLGIFLGEPLGGSPGQSAPGDLHAVLLRGEMGSGKTSLTRGLVAALPGGDEAEIASPSFTLINMYPTTPPVLHADLFRCTPGIAPPEELEEALDPAAWRWPLVLIEWPEHLPSALVPPKRLDILLQACHGSRLFSVTAWGETADRLCAALAEWAAREHPDWLRPTPDATNCGTPRL